MLPAPNHLKLPIPNGAKRREESLCVFSRSGIGAASCHIILAFAVK